MMPFSQLKQSAKLLVLVNHGIGDVIMSSPMLKVLNSDKRNFYISLLVQERTEPIIDATIFHETIFYRIDLSVKEKIKFIRDLRVKSFDAIVVSDGVSLKLSIILFYLLGAKYFLSNTVNISNRYKFKYYKDKLQKHCVEKNLAILGTEYVNKKYINLTLPISKHDEHHASNWIVINGLSKKKVIGFHAGCNDLFFRRWPLERFSQVADWVYEKYSMIPIFFGGTNESDLIAKIQSGMKYESFSQAGEMTLMETAALISKMNLFVSNDSGLLQIASAVAVPSVSVYIPGYLFQSPYGNNHKIISLTDLECAKECQPLSCNNVICINSIKVEQVQESIQAQMLSLTK